MKTFQVLSGWQKGNSSLYLVNLLLQVYLKGQERCRATKEAAN